MTSSFGDLPILAVVVPTVMEWEQHAPGGCRCLCLEFHDGADEVFCVRAAEPGLFTRVISEEKLLPGTGPKEIGTVVLCRRCYRAIAAHTATAHG